MIKKHAFKQKPKFSIPEMMLLALAKLVNAPFEILLDYGKIGNQISPSATRMALHRLKRKELVCCKRQGKKFVFFAYRRGRKRSG